MVVLHAVLQVAVLHWHHTLQNLQRVLETASKMSTEASVFLPLLLAALCHAILLAF